MSLLARIAGLEAATTRPPAGDDGDGLPLGLAELDDDALDRVVVNLLLAIGAPADAATAAVWARASAGGLDTLTAAEFDALYRWLTAEEGDVPAMLGAAMPRVSRPLGTGE